MGGPQGLRLVVPLDRDVNVEAHRRDVERESLEGLLDRLPDIDLEGRPPRRLEEVAHGARHLGLVHRLGEEGRLRHDLDSEVDHVLVLGFGDLLGLLL